MNENPFQPPKMPDDEQEENFLKSELKRQRLRQRTWSQRCWVFGGVLILIGFLTLNLSHNYLIVGRSNHLILVDVFALAIVILGFGMISIGPTTWYWFNRD